MTARRDAAVFHDVPSPFSSPGERRGAVADQVEHKSCTGRRGWACHHHGENTIRIFPTLQASRSTRTCDVGVDDRPARWRRRCWRSFVVSTMSASAWPHRAVMPCDPMLRASGTGASLTRRGHRRRGARLEGIDDPVLCWGDTRQHTSSCRSSLQFRVAEFSISGGEHQPAGSATNIAGDGLGSVL